MKIPEKKWGKSKVEQILNIFPGRLSEILSKIHGIKTKNLEKFSPHIFWRWYFLENLHCQHSNPFYGMDHIKKIENWPASGMFFPQIKAKMAGDGVDFDCKVDFINFKEQPLIVDLQRKLAGKTLLYDFDEPYRKDLKFLAGKIVNKGIYPDDISSKKNLKWLIEEYLDYKLDHYYRVDPFVSNSFSTESWRHLWREIIETMRDENDFSSERILDKVVNRIRLFYPDFGLTSDEIKNENEEELPDFKAGPYVIFWINISAHLIVPFSLYLHLLAPTFLDQLEFEQQVEDILTHTYSEPMPFYTAFSYLGLTDFGKDIFRENL